jgi:Tol biopolymer transport system component
MGSNASMTESSKAVFLSYASQDTQAAQRICEALRAAGIEVWFDQSELRGGEAWDRQIRKQIHTCALFVPIISAHTQARLEGYFRREWKLAADRTHDMAEERAFLVPVVIDDTSERYASVPDKFRDVQWTRLPAGDTSPAFIERVSRLLAAHEPPATAGKSAERHPGAATPAESPRAAVEARPPEAQPARLPDRKRKFVPRNQAVLAAAAILAAVAVLVFGLLRRAPDHVLRDPLTEAKVTRLTDIEGTEQAASISRDGRLVAFLADRDGHPDVWLTEIGSNHYRNLTNGQFRQLRNPEIRSLAFSPDGALVTFWTRSGEGTRAADINVMGAPTAGGALEPYLREGVEFDWSPDGTQMVFHTSAPGDPMFVRATGEATVREIYVAAPGIHCHFPTWSPDGEFIYFVRGDPPSADWDVWRIRPSGAGAERVTFHNTRVSYPVLLDSRTLVYLATDTDGSGPWLHVMDVQLGREHRVGFGLERYTSLAASANGRRIVATVANFRSELWRATVASGGPQQSTAIPVEPALGSVSAARFGPDYIAYVSTAAGRRGIWKLANGTVSRLWDDPSADRIGAPAIAPNGRRIAFIVERHAATQLYVVDSDGGNPRAIGPALALRGDLAWAPDSQSIIGAIVRDGEPRLARIFLDGSSPRSMVSDYSVDPVWSPDGTYFVYSGAQVATTFPLRASAPDGRPYGMPGLILTIGARRIAFSRNSGSLVVLRGGIDRKDFWRLDPQTGAARQLTDLPASFVIGDFDVSPDGTEIIFERVQESSSIALIEPTR